MIELNAVAESLEQQVAEKLKSARLAAERKTLETRINTLKRKLDGVDDDANVEMASEAEPKSTNGIDKEINKQSVGMTKYLDADGKIYCVIDKRDLPQRMEDSQGFRRACDPRRHRELLLSEGTLINSDHVRQRLEARGGDNLLASTIDPIWESTALWEKVRSFQIFSGRAFDSFLKFKSHWKDYSLCSLEHFVNGKLDDEDRSAIVLAIDGQQATFCYVFGEQWGSAWEPLKKRILMGDLRQVNAPYLRFELEVAWSSFCNIMRNVYHDEEHGQVDISLSSRCVQVLMDIYEKITVSTAREMRYQGCLSLEIIRTQSCEVKLKVDNGPTISTTVVDHPRSGVSVVMEPRKTERRENLICMAQLLHVYRVNGPKGKKLDPCPHGRNCVFYHVGWKEKSKEELVKAVGDSRAKLLTTSIRAALLQAINKV